MHMYIWVGDGASLIAGLEYVCISDIVTNIPKLEPSAWPISPISVLINLLIISSGQDASGVREKAVSQTQSGKSHFDLAI